MILKNFCVNPDVLKIVALVTMTIDHFYKILIPDAKTYFIGTDVIGRVAMPLFAGLMMYHLAKRQIFKKYLIRLTLFGIMSTCLFWPFTMWGHTAAMPLNILLSFALAILTIFLLEAIEKDTLVSKPVKKFAKMVVLLFMAPFTVCFDYSLNGFCYFLMFYYYFKSPNVYRLYGLLLLSILVNGIAISGIISMLTTLFFVNVDMDRHYPRVIKNWYTFYMYYPLHRLLLHALAYLMMS